MSRQQQKAKSSSIWQILLQLMVLILIVVNGYLIYNISVVNRQYNKIEKEVASSREANEKVLAMLNEIKDKQIEQTEKIASLTNVSYIRRYNRVAMKKEGYSIYTDVGAYSDISVSDMERIINYYEEHIRHTEFVGHADAFIEASKRTGLNPVYLFAHASCESSFGNSYYAVTRHNYFGINAVDSNPDAAYKMGDGVTEGIVAGAEWIKSNYYDYGYTTLADMHNGGYATDPEWASNIVSIANDAIEKM